MRWSGAAWISSSTVPAASTRPEALVLRSGAAALASAGLVILAAEKIGVRKQTAAAERGDFASCLTWEIGVWNLLSMILFDAGLRMEDTRGVIRVSRVKLLAVSSSALSHHFESLALIRGQGLGQVDWEFGGQKNAGLKAATLISVSNPVSQVLW